MITRVQRAWVVTVLGLLIVPGVIGFDLWPLTGWRLFSLSRDAAQTEWALDVRADGDDHFVEVDLEALPLAYRNAAWPMAELPRASEARRLALCEALLVGVRDVMPDAAELALVREDRVMTIDDGQTTIRDDRRAVQQCD